MTAQAGVHARTPSVAPRAGQPGARAYRSGAEGKPRSTKKTGRIDSALKPDETGMARLPEVRSPAGSIVAGRARQVGATAEIANHAVGNVETVAGLERIRASREPGQYVVREEPVARGPYQRRRIDVRGAHEEAAGPAGWRVGKPVEGHGRTCKESTERPPRKQPVAPGIEALPRKQIVRKEAGAADVVGVAIELHLNATETEKKFEGRRCGRLVLDADA